ncbi:hypothetical protein ANN_00641, partial [Periplaneta americana]
RINLSQDDGQFSQCVLEISKKIFLEGQEIFFYTSDTTSYQEAPTLDIFTERSFNVTLKEVPQCSLQTKTTKASIPMHYVTSNYKDSASGNEHILRGVRKGGKPWSAFSYNNYITLVSFRDNDLYSLKKTLYNHMDHMYVSFDMNPSGRYLILLTGNPTTEEVPISLLKFMVQYYGLNDVIVASKDVEIGVVKFYTWNPYEKPSGYCGVFQQAFLLATCRNGELDVELNHFFLSDYNNYFPNLHGCCINPLSMTFMSPSQCV